MKESAMLNDRKSPIIDAEIEGSLRDKPLNFRAALSREDAYCGAEFVAIATPTDYDPNTNIQHSQRRSSYEDVIAINPAPLWLSSLLSR